MSFQCISIAEAEKLLAAGDATLLDIRDPQSFNAGNIENAIHVSNENVEQIVATAARDKPLIIYCYHGNTSKSAADYFFNRGFSHSYSVDGGYEEWKLKVRVKT